MKVVLAYFKPGQFIPVHSPQVEVILCIPEGEAENDACFNVFNPATGEKISAVADGDQKDAARAIESAARAFKSWSSLTAYQRSGYLYDAYHIMMERKEDLARVMTQEQGKPLKAARNEVQYDADFLLWYVEEAKRVYGETIPAPRPMAAGLSGRVCFL